MTFTTNLDQLALKELRLANEAQVAAATALVAFSRSIGCSSSSRLGALGRTGARVGPSGLDSWAGKACSALSPQAHSAFAPSQFS